MIKSPNDFALRSEIQMMFSKLSNRNIFETLEADQPRDLRKLWCPRRPAGYDRNKSAENILINRT